MMPESFWKPNVREILLQGLTDRQSTAVKSDARRLMVIAGAGSGKTDVMARRVAWLVAGKGIPKDEIIAFTFTEAAAEELKFRIRKYIEDITAEGNDATLGDMYVGTIHGFCLSALRDFAPEEYYTYEILDEATRIALVHRGFKGRLALDEFRATLPSKGIYDASQAETVDKFLRGFDLLNEYDTLEVELPDGPIPSDVAQEQYWVSRASLAISVGSTAEAKAFSKSAARFYAFMRARRFLDFSTSQSELTRLLTTKRQLLSRLRKTRTHLVVDEVQDINPVQLNLIKLIVGTHGHITAVGDHRQAIYAFRGGRVDLMGDLYAEFCRARDGEVIELQENFRSSPRIIDLANRWARTIGQVGQMPTPDMAHGGKKGPDYHSTHVSLLHFAARQEEAEWISKTIKKMVVQTPSEMGIKVDANGEERGITLSDIAILVRSAKDVSTYQNALNAEGVHTVVRAGPDLFSQPEVLLFVALLADASGQNIFVGSPNDDRSLPNRIAAQLGCAPEPRPVIRTAIRVLRQKGLPIEDDAQERLLLLSKAIVNKLTEGGGRINGIERLHCSAARKWVASGSQPTRVFPQTIFHWFLEEAGIRAWDASPAFQPAIFHLGQLSGLVKGLETPGWTSATDFPFQVSALVNWATIKARTEQARLLVPPNAVTIMTIHGAKGLEFPVVFVADVNASRFPSSRSRTPRSLPMAGRILQTIDPSRLADNANYDDERRLMYVALTRAERYLFVSSTGTRTSTFIKEMRQIFSAAGAFQGAPISAPQELIWMPSSYSRKDRLTTNFSDLSYFLECPHDFYLRKVIGFAPAIDQAFGYGRGVHNVLREIHENPRNWARIALDPDRLEREIKKVVEGPMFYMRYTTGSPLDNLRNKAIQGIKQYVATYLSELAAMDFEPEREFETMLDEEKLLVTGSIDLVRHTDPPRVSIIDFKSGAQKGENESGLSKELMQLQIGVYGIAAKKELEYEPDEGLIRYIGEPDPQKREIQVVLSADQLEKNREIITQAGREIRERKFDQGPTSLAPNRCNRCDFSSFCGRAISAKN